MKNLLIYFVLFNFCQSYSQDSIPTFLETLRFNSSNYIQKSNEAYAKNDFKIGKQLFDSLVSHKLIGTRFNNLTVKTFSSKEISFDKIKKPVLIITYASWCIINKGDIPALNQLSKKHNDDIKIIIIFWGDKTEAKRISRLFRKNIQVAYTGFEENENFDFVSQLKNTLGYPTSYFIDSNKKVINISRISNPYSLNISSEKALSDSYDQFNSIIDKSLNSNNKNNMATIDY